MIVDCRKKKTQIAFIIFNGEPIENVDCFKFLGKVIANEYGWVFNTLAGLFFF